MGALARLVRSLLEMADLPAWVGGAFLVALLVVCLPMMRVNFRTADARKLLKHASRERGAERERLEAQALAIVGCRPDGLVVVAREALEQGRKPLATLAVEKLRATGKKLPELRRLEHALDPPVAGTAAEACIVIEQMLAAGLTEHARDRLAHARRRWPLDPELEALDVVDSAGQPLEGAS